MEHLHLEGMKRREAGFQEYGILPYRHVCARVSPVHAHRCKNLRPQQFVGTVNTHSMATRIQYSGKAQGAILKRGVRQYAECVGWAIYSTHHLNGCLGAARLAYTKIPRNFFPISKSNFQRRNQAFILWI